MCFLKSFIWHGLPVSKTYTRLAYGVFLMRWGTTGLYASDYIEFPFQSGRNWKIYKWQIPHPPGRPLVKKFPTSGTQLWAPGVAESSSGQQFGISRVGPARKSYFLGACKKSFIYQAWGQDCWILASLLFAFLLASTRSINTQKITWLIFSHWTKKLGQ